MKLLSLFLSLVLLLTGVAFAEEPATPVSTVVTVRDAVLTIQGEEYPLNPSLVFGFAADENSALLDFGMPLGDDILFPVQAKIDENGAAVLLGDSKTAYTFTPEFFTSSMADMEIPAEAVAMLTSCGNLIRACASLEDSVTPEMNQAVEEKANELITVTEGEEAQFEANGETQTGTTMTISIDADQMRELMDYAYTQLPADFTAAYFDYINTMFALVGGPEISSFGELMDFAGVDMSLSGEMIANETSGAGEIVFHVSVDPSVMNESLTETAEAAAGEVIIEKEPEVETKEAAIGIIGGADGPTSIMVTGVTTITEPVSFDIPMQITIHNPEYVECTADMELEGIQMNIYASQQADALTASIAYDIPEAGTIVIEAVEAPQEDGSVSSGFSMNADVEGSQFALLCEGESLNGESAHSVGLAYADEAFSAELYFTVEQANEPITDRIADAKVKEINSFEDAEKSVGLIAAAVGLAGDAEPLLNDESIIALIDVAKEFFGLNMTAAAPEITEEIALTEENPELSENTQDAESAALPEFTFLPEGYEVSESYYDAEFGCYSVTLLHTEDVNFDKPMYVNIYSYEETTASPDYYSISDGAAQPINGVLAQVYRSDDPDFPTRNAYASFGSYDADLFTYDPALADEDLVNILAGIVF